MLPNTARFPMACVQSDSGQGAEGDCADSGDAAATRQRPEQRARITRRRCGGRFRRCEKKIQGDIKKLGGFDSLTMTLVERGEFEGMASYRYRLEFAKMTVIQHYVLDEQGRLAAAETEELRGTGRGRTG